MKDIEKLIKKMKSEGKSDKEIGAIVEQMMAAAPEDATGVDIRIEKTDVPSNVKGGLKSLIKGAAQYVAEGTDPIIGVPETQNLAEKLAPTEEEEASGMHDAGRMAAEGAEMFNPMDITPAIGMVGVKGLLKAARKSGAMGQLKKYLDETGLADKFLGKVSKETQGVNDLGTDLDVADYVSTEPSIDDVLENRVKSKFTAEADVYTDPAEYSRAGKEWMNALNKIYQDGNGSITPDMYEFFKAKAPKFVGEKDLSLDMADFMPEFINSDAAPYYVGKSDASGKRAEDLLSGKKKDLNFMQYVNPKNFESGTMGPMAPSGIPPRNKVITQQRRKSKWA